MKTAVMAERRTERTAAVGEEDGEEGGEEEGEEDSEDED